MRDNLFYYDDRLSGLNMLCRVTGSLINIGGNIPAGAVLSFVRADASVFSGAVVLPGVRVVVPRDGALTVDLFPGRYGVRVGDCPVASIIVPVAASADLADLLDWGTTTLVVPMIEWRRGADNIFCLTLREADGRPPDPLGVSLNMRVMTPAGCIRIEATRSEEKDADYEFDLSAYRLPMGTFTTDIWLHDGAGDTFLRRIALRITGDYDAGH